MAKPTLTGEEFVHVTPRRFVASIVKHGLDPGRVGGIVFVTKLKYVVRRTARQLEAALYRKDLIARKRGYLETGGFALIVLPVGTVATYYGMTTRPGGIPQWVVQGPPIRDVRILLDSVRVME